MGKTVECLDLQLRWGKSGCTAYDRRQKDWQPVMSLVQKHGLLYMQYNEFGILRNFLTLYREKQRTFPYDQRAHYLGLPTQDDLLGQAMISVKVTQSVEDQINNVPLCAHVVADDDVEEIDLEVSEPEIDLDPNEKKESVDKDREDHDWLVSSEPKDRTDEEKTVYLEDEVPDPLPLLPSFPEDSELSVKDRPDILHLTDVPSQNERTAHPVNKLMDQWRPTSGVQPNS